MAAAPRRKHHNPTLRWKTLPILIPSARIYTSSNVWLLETVVSGKHGWSVLAPVVPNTASSNWPRPTFLQSGPSTTIERINMWVNKFIAQLRKFCVGSAVVDVICSTLTLNESTQQVNSFSEMQIILKCLNLKRVWLYKLSIKIKVLPHWLTNKYKWSIRIKWFNVLNISIVLRYCFSRGQQLITCQAYHYVCGIPLAIMTRIGGSHMDGNEIKILFDNIYLNIGSLEPFNLHPNIYKYIFWNTFIITKTSFESIWQIG